MFEAAELLLSNEPVTEGPPRDILDAVGFQDERGALERLKHLTSDPVARGALAVCLPSLMMALMESASPDGSLVNFERYVQSVESPERLFRYLASEPRAVEILFKLFVGSQFLTEILLRDPHYLEELTRHKRLADFKSRAQLFGEATAAAGPEQTLEARIDALRKFHHWELLRLGACDSFGLMDLKTVTLQLSLLADSLVQACLTFIAEDASIPLDGFIVLAFGKLGGEELNYSSDIDLVFVAERNASQYWGLGQRVIRALMDATSRGFMYRVDMRLRPWGRSGPLVTSTDAYRDYLVKHAQLWEKQALLKARPIAGDIDAGYALLADFAPQLFGHDPEELRESVRKTKQTIETELEKRGRKWGEVKAGRGSIRDVEFVVQYLQLAHGEDYPGIRSINTLDALVRLADYSIIQADEYRQLTGGYLFLRTIEHSLQLMHYKQVHSLPDDPREQLYLARRLDFPSAEVLLTFYERHCTSIRRVFEKYLEGRPAGSDAAVTARPVSAAERLAKQNPSYATAYSSEQQQRHRQLFDRLNASTLVAVDVTAVDATRYELTMAGFDYTGELAVICGLLFAQGFDIAAGKLFTIATRPDGLFPAGTRRKSLGDRRQFLCSMTVTHPEQPVPAEVWQRFETDLADLTERLGAGKSREAHGQLARQVAKVIDHVPKREDSFLPLEIVIDNSLSPDSTVLDISAPDTPGFLFELANALALTGTRVDRVVIQSVGSQVADTLYVTDIKGHKITDQRQLGQIRTAVVLIKHFSHLLPRSPNPEAALLHFRDLLEQLLQGDQWLERLASLERPKVLDALARLLGVSEFLWEDFLRLQHDNLFPVIANIEELEAAKPKAAMAAELAAELAHCSTREARIAAINALKDREMLRADLRHILGYEDTFGQFSLELTDVAEVVVEAATTICQRELAERYGEPQLEDGSPCELAVCALGKCGGKELGFASDIELMFVYAGAGRTAGGAAAETLTNGEFYHRLVELFQQTIRARSAGIFEIDLRLRPYGRAGSLAVALEAFTQYFQAEGPAWPYERQALVKLRPFCGDATFCEQVTTERDRVVYVGEAFDVSAMRAMREKQIRQLVKAGTLNAKLSPGGLVDCEYLVQGLQVTFGHLCPELRSTNTRVALKALEQCGVISPADRLSLRDCYRFLRRIIDALRMVRGDARDLTIPALDSEQFDFLARRLGHTGPLAQLQAQIEETMQKVQGFSRLLNELGELIPRVEENWRMLEELRREA